MLLKTVLKTRDMKSKYLINVKKISHSKRNRTLTIYLAFLLLVALAIWLIIHFVYGAETKIVHSKASITKVGSSTTASNLTTYSASNFSFKMSSGWSRVAVQGSPYQLYEWQTGSGADYQTIDVFENSSTSNLAVNRVIIVSANGNQINVLGQPSDNCANFTNGHKTSTLSGYPAKWQGVAFNCNLNSTETDTVGISSAQSINNVSLTSPSGTKDNFYFLYTDHSLSPSYADFDSLLTTFTLQ